MEMTLEDKKLLTYYLATTFFNKLENSFYQLVLPADASTSESILETILLGVSYLSERMKKILGAGLWQEAFTSDLKQYTQAYITKHSIELPWDFHILWSERMRYNAIFIQEYIFKSPTSNPPEDLITRIIVFPLKRTIPELKYSEKGVMEFYGLLKLYTRMIDKILTPLEKDILEGLA
jgi:hypothetical protein